MITQWGLNLDPMQVLQEYPRPQLRRNRYLNLNGLWQYAITQNEQEPLIWDGDILVPFSPESALSGVNRTITAEDTLWYRRSFALPEGFMQSRLLLHFGAVDQDAVVYVNGTEVCRHEGGYNAFSAEISSALCQGENTLTVRVKDDTDASWRTRGKQKTERGGIWYTPQSGIWQTVWFESVPQQYIHALRLTPHVDASTLEVLVVSDSSHPCTLTFQDVQHNFAANTPFHLPVASPQLWSPENPYLYPLTLMLGQDTVESYFAMRSTCVKPDSHGVKRLFLNGKPYFHNGLLDQGYWPDGLYTPPSDEAMIYDIQITKDMGFNMLRKHIKVEPMRWYYHCDRLGMLVWQDMPNGCAGYTFRSITAPLFTGIHHNDHDYRFFNREAEEGRLAYRRELAEMVHQLYNCPSIVLWVPFNEGWGQFDAKAACALIDEADGTRPIDPASGWHDQRNGDLVTRHVYFRRYRFRRDRRRRAVALSEFGGYNLSIPGHTWTEVDYGYKRFKDAPAFQAAYENLYDTQILPAIPKGLCATVFTQLTDVEDELNGLLTYDRQVCKIPIEALQSLNSAITKAGGAE